MPVISRRQPDPAGPVSSRHGSRSGNSNARPGPRREVRHLEPLGPQSVPMSGDWYARHMYVPRPPAVQSSPAHLAASRRDGWKDVVRPGKRSGSTPTASCNCMSAAGSNYFVAQAVASRQFRQLDFDASPLDAAKMVPKKDIVRPLARPRRPRIACRSAHRASPAPPTIWYSPNKMAILPRRIASVPFDGARPRIAAISTHPSHTETEIAEGRRLQAKGDTAALVTDNPYWRRAVGYLRIKDLIDQFEPDLLYSDGELPFGQTGLSIVAHRTTSAPKRQAERTTRCTTRSNMDPNSPRRRVRHRARPRWTGRRLRPGRRTPCRAGWSRHSRAYKTPKQIYGTLVGHRQQNGTFC